MKRSISILLLLLLAGVHSTRGQRLTPTLGTLTDSEKTMTRYEPDPQAAAVVLFDIGESYFFDSENGYDIRFTRMKRTKIFSRAGFDEATVSIPFYVESPSKKEKVTSIEAYTYILKDGLVYKKALEASAVFEEQISNQVRVKKFTFPDVQEGCIIEYKYVFETPFMFNLPDWEFQGSIPAVYSEYTVKMIPFYEYVFIAQGITKFNYQLSEASKKKRTWGVVTETLGGKTGGGVEFTDMVHTYGMSDIPAFKDASLITSKEDYIMKMDFQLSKFYRPSGGSQAIISTWPDLNKGFLDHDRFGKYINASVKLSKKILEKELILGADLSTDKKCEAIMDYVHTTFRWDEHISNFSSKTAKEFLDQKTGNSADINLFLVGLLKAAGIQAEPVLISTRNHGKIKSDYPFAHYFNDVIVFVAGQRSFLMDGTDNMLSYDRIPVRCINEKGLVVTEGEVKWVGLEQRVPSAEDYEMHWTIDPGKATASLTVKIAANEYKAYDYRSQFAGDSTKISKHLQASPETKVHRIQALNIDKPRLPYVLTFNQTTALEHLENKLVIQPLLNFPLQENPLQQQVRTYPVDFVYPQSGKFRSFVDIPAGYRVESLPESISMDNEMARIILNATPSATGVEIAAEYVLKKSVYPPADYSKLKFYLGMIVKGFNVPVVLSKP